MALQQSTLSIITRAMQGRNVQINATRGYMPRDLVDHHVAKAAKHSVGRTAVELTEWGHIPVLAEFLMGRLGITEEDAAGIAVSLANVVPTTQSLFMAIDSGDNHANRTPIMGGRVKVLRVRGMYKPPAEAIEDVKPELKPGETLEGGIPGMLSAETFGFTEQARVWRAVQCAESFSSIHNDLYFTGGSTQPERTTYRVVIPIGEFGAALALGEPVELAAGIPKQAAYLKYSWGDMLSGTSQIIAGANEPPRTNRLPELVHDLEPIRKAEAEERAKDVAGFMASVMGPVIEQQVNMLRQLQEALAPLR